jgi:hypothetical protein
MLIQYNELSKMEKFTRFLSDFFSFSSPSAERQLDKARLLGRVLTDKENIQKGDESLLKIRTIYHDTFLDNSDCEISGLRLLKWDRRLRWLLQRPIILIPAMLSLKLAKERKTENVRRLDKGDCFRR